MTKIRFMKESDVGQVAVLEKKCFSRPWSEKSFLDAVRSEDTLYLVAEVEGEVKGYCGFYLSFENADLCNMLVEEGMRKKGIGKMLLNAADSYLRERKIETVFLEVRAGNIPAICLYEKMNFIKNGIRKEYYAEPVEDAILMQKTFH